MLGRQPPASDGQRVQEKKPLKGGGGRVPGHDPLHLHQHRFSSGFHYPHKEQPDDRCSPDNVKVSLAFAESDAICLAQSVGHISGAHQPSRHTGAPAQLPDQYPPGLSCTSLPSAWGPSSPLPSSRASPPLCLDNSLGLNAEWQPCMPGGSRMVPRWARLILHPLWPDGDAEEQRG